MPDSNDEKAVARVARHEGRSAVAPLQNTVPGVQKKAAPDVFGCGAVAFVTVLHQHRPDFLFKEIELREVGGRSHGRSERQQASQNVRFHHGAGLFRVWWVRPGGP